MTATKTTTVTTETHELTHEQLVEAISEYVKSRSRIDSPDSCTVEIWRDCSWEAEGKDEYCATVKIDVRS